jgi:hypothetical protein
VRGAGKLFSGLLRTVTKRGGGSSVGSPSPSQMPNSPITQASSPIRPPGSPMRWSSSSPARRSNSPVRQSNAGESPSPMRSISAAPELLKQQRPYDLMMESGEQREVFRRMVNPSLSLHID